MEGLFILFFHTFAFSASCCGGGSALPSFITSDSKAQFSLRYSNVEVLGNVSSRKEFTLKDDRNKEMSRILTLQTVYQMNNLWQISGTIPIQEKTQLLNGKQTQGSGMGDFNLSIAYEFLPELEYSPWKPRGFIFTQLTLPTAPSIYDHSDSSSTQIRGKGFYTPGWGAFFIKNWEEWDLHAQFEVHRSLERTYQFQTSYSSDDPDHPFENSRSEVHLVPGLGWTMMLGFGYSPGESNLRYGLDVVRTYEDKIHIPESGFSDSLPKWNWDVTATLSYLIQSTDMVSFSINDPTLIKDYYNTTLEKHISFLYQHRWSL